MTEIDSCEEEPRDLLDLLDLVDQREEVDEVVVMPLSSLFLAKSVLSTILCDFVSCPWSSSSNGLHSLSVIVWLPSRRWVDDVSEMRLRLLFGMLPFLGIRRNVFETSNFGWRREKNLRQNIKVSFEFSLDLGGGGVDFCKYYRIVSDYPPIRRHVQSNDRIATTSPIMFPAAYNCPEYCCPQGGITKE